MKPLLEDPGVLKIGQNLKFDLQIFALRGIALAPYDDTMLMSYVLDAGRSGHGLEPLANRYFDHATIDLDAITGSGKSRITFDCVDDRQGRRIRRRGRRPDAAAVAGAQAADGRRAHRRRSTRRWSGRSCRCSRAWSGAASRSTGRCCRGCRASSPSAPARSRPRSRSSPASRSIPAARSSSATSCSASFGFPAAPRPRPANGRPARACWTSWPSRDTRCRERFSTGGRSPSSNRPTPTRCRATSIPTPIACTRATRSRRPRPAASPPPSRTCRTSRSAPRKAARSGAPSSRSTATSSSPPTIRRSSCGSWPRSPTSRRCETPSATGSTSTP